MAIETWVDQDLQQPVCIHHLGSSMFTQDNLGNLLGVKLLRNGEAATVSGTVSGSVVRPDGGTVAVSGSLSGNRASITLPQAAYAYPGLIGIVIKLTTGTAVTTIGAFTAVVVRSATGVTVDPGTIIPDIAALINQIQTVAASVPADYSTLSQTVSGMQTSKADATTVSALTQTVGTKASKSELQTGLAGKADKEDFDSTKGKVNSAIVGPSQYTLLDCSTDLTDRSTGEVAIDGETACIYLKGSNAVSSLTVVERWTEDGEQQEIFTMIQAPSVSGSTPIFNRTRSGAENYKIVVTFASGTTLDGLQLCIANGLVTLPFEFQYAVNAGVGYDQWSSATKTIINNQLAGKFDVSNIAPAWTAYIRYSANSFVTRFGKLYRITEEGVYGTWANVPKEETTVFGMVQALLAAQGGE